MTDRSVKDHLSSPPNAQGDRGVKTGPVEADDRIPDRFDVAGVETYSAWVGLAVTSGGDLLGVEDANVDRKEILEARPPHQPPRS
jgi:hypothetical protein